MRSIEEGPVEKTSFLPKMIRYIVVGMFFFVLAVELFAYIEPWLFPLHMIQGNARHVTANIIVGPYPTAPELARLKERENVVEVISLMSASIPLDSPMLEKERREVKANDLIFHNRPMSFLRLRSDANRRTARSLATAMLAKYGKNAKGRVYINCYFGRDRVGLLEETFKQIIAQRAGRSDPKATLTKTAPRIKQVDQSDKQAP